MPSSMAQSSTEVHKAPDWEMKPMCPVSGVAAARLAFERDGRHDDAQAVRTEDPHAVELACSVEHGPLEFAAFLADLAEAGRNDHDAPRARLAALPHQGGDASPRECRSPPGPADAAGS